MKKLLLSIFTITTFFQLGYSQKTYVPDDNFEAYLEANGMGDGINSNDSVTTANISGITNLNVNNQNISDLTGLEAFTSLTGLNCGGNPQLTYLDVSQNYALVSILSRSSGLININFGTISNIKSLDLLNNQLTSLDLTSLVQLEGTYFRDNQLTSLDVSQNINLKNLKIEKNQISSIDISQNTQLTYLSCWKNQITALDVSQNLLLETISAEGNQISSLDVTMLDSLNSLYCGGNLLTSMDVTQNPLLETLICGSNQLTALDVSQNPLLSYLICNESQLSSLNISQNPLITYLRCNGNQITNLDVTQNPLLETLRCDNNQLTALDVSQNPLLSFLRCPYNQIPTLDVTMLDSLTLLYCAGNLLASLDVTQNSLLKHLKCGSNQLPTLNVTQNPVLEYLTCGYNPLTSLDVTQNINLKVLGISSSQISNIDVTQNTLLYNFGASGALLSSIDISQNLLLESLQVQGNLLTSLDISNNNLIEYLRCDGNQLNSLNVSQNPLISYLTCNGNLLSYLNVKNGNNTNFTHLRANGNSNLYCVTVDDSNYSDTAWLNPLNTNFNFDTIVSFSNNCNPTTGNNNNVAIDCSLLTLSASNDTICSGASVVLGSNYSSINVTPTVLEVPNEYPTIQAAIDSASDYDTVYVHSGIYVENIVFNNKSIFLIGQDRNNTIIDGNQTCPVINLTGNSTVESLKIQNAGGVCYGGGIRATGNDSKLVRNCIITNNILSDTASTRGGAILGNNALRISNCVISNNFASSYCGGIYNAGFIQNSIVSNNHLTGIFGVDTIINCISFDNGIGVYNFGPDSTIIKNSTFLRNNEGVKYTNSLGNTIENSIFQENNKNITFWNAGSTSYSTVTTDYSILQGGQTSNGLSNSSYLSTYGDAYWGSNINDTIASFIDSANGNFNLVPGTPGYDQGNPDLNNNGISWANDPQDQDPDGSRMDLGYNSNFTSNDFGIGNSNFSYLWSTGDSSQTTVINPSQSGYYSLNINSGNYNCSDSIFIHVLNSSSYTEIQTTCDSVVWNGSSYDSTGIYIDTLQNYLGCDSVITLDLTVGQPIYVTEIQSDCDSVVWNGTSYLNSGIYTDSLLTIDGCDSIVTLDVDITGANLAFTVTPVSLIAPPFIFPFNNTTPNMGNFDFTWDFGDGTVIPTNNTNITHEYQYNGVYSVKLISEDMVNNCGIDTLAKPNLINCSGGPSLSIAEAFSNLVLYPNPAKYMVNIDYGTEDNFNTHYIEIINNLGQQVFLNTIDASNIQIPVSNFGSKGFYFINIRNENNDIIVTKHLIIN
jgi:Leucine-rich repeat (LRR) protein